MISDLFCFRLEPPGPWKSQEVITSTRITCKSPVVFKKTKPRHLLVNMGFWGFSQKLFCFHDLKWNSGGLGVSKRTAPTVRCYLQSFIRFGGTWCQKVNFSTFSGKQTFQCSRNCPQNHPFCPGSLQDTFIIYSSISHQHFSNNIFPNKKSRESKI